MKLLIAIKSCQGDRHNGMHQAIRETWGKDVAPAGAELLFFFGNNSNPNLLPIDLQPDEVLLNLSDDYHELPRKTRGILGFALFEHRYDFVYLCDTDTYVIPHKLMQTGFEQYDYFGMIGLDRQPGVTFNYTAPDRNRKRWVLPKCHPWASGGVGYFLSHKAMEIIAPLEPNIWAEDLWVGQIMGPLYLEGKIRMAHSDLEGKAAWHFPRTMYYRGPKPLIPIADAMKKWQHDMYKENR